MESNQAPKSRRGAKNAEAGQYKRPEYSSLNGDQFECSLPWCFLCGLRVSAVSQRALRLHRYGLGSGHVNADGAFEAGAGDRVVVQGLDLRGAGFGQSGLRA